MDALGCSISGSGPSIFAFCENENQAKEVGEKWRTVLNTDLEIDSKNLNLSKNKILEGLISLKPS